MKYSKAFSEANERLKTLDEEALNDELNQMTSDELFAHADCMMQQTLGEENLLDEAEAQAQIDRLLQLTREPSKDETKPIRIHTQTTAKRILILAAAILILFSVFVASAVASKRDFSIFNGAVRVEHGKVYVRFTTADPADFLSLTELEADLRAHGFDNLTLPAYFRDGDWHVNDLVYYNGDKLLQANFRLSNGLEAFDEGFLISVSIHEKEDYAKQAVLQGLEGAETVKNEKLSVFLFDHGDGCFDILYYIKQFSYRITASAAEDKMRGIAETLT